MSAIPFKLLLHRGRDCEIRRFRGEYNYSQLNTAIGEAWGTLPKDLQIAYEDPDGDRVRIGSQLEWEECLRLFRETDATQPLKLHVSRFSKKELKQRKNTDEPRVPKERRNKKHHNKDHSSSSSDTSSDSSDSEAEKKATKAPTDGATAKENEDVAASILGLLSRMFGPRAASEMPDPQGLFACLQNAFFDPSSGELHADLDRSSLRRIIVEKTNGLMDRHEHDAARNVLAAACALFNSDALLQYNCACAHALCGMPDEALVYLRQAVESGYSDVVHLIEDTDLASLHGGSGFDEVVALCAAKNLAREGAREDRGAAQQERRGRCGGAGNGAPWWQHYFRVHCGRRGDRAADNDREERGPSHHRRQHAERKGANNGDRRSTH